MLLLLLLIFFAWLIVLAAALLLCVMAHTGDEETARVASPPVTDLGIASSSQRQLAWRIRSTAGTPRCSTPWDG